MKLLKLEDLKQLLGVSHATIYKWMNLGLFPRPVRMQRTVRWLESEIFDFISKKNKEKR